MPYYCKKCGAVVTGKFCSCCGTRATDDFTDFRKAQRRMEKDFCQKASAAHDGKDRSHASRIANLALDIAFDRLLPYHALTVDAFDQYSDYCWKKLPECRELAELLYERAVGVLLLK